jgi:hypothetical protein
LDPNVAFPENWTPPRELSRALPRETTLSGRGMFNIILGGIFLIAAIALGFWIHNDGAQQAQQTSALHAQGQEANAEITRLSREGKGSTPAVAYAFTANGVRIVGHASAPNDLWPKLQKAGFLLVRYLPSNPAVNHPAAWDPDGVPAWFPVLIPAMWAVGALILLNMLRRQAQVAAEGIPAPGVVTKCSRIKGGWSARYQFRTKDGAIVKGRDRVYSKLEPGANVCVLYLAEKPRRSYLYPLCLYRVAP